MYGKLSVFTGNANPGLVSSICAHVGVPLGHAEVFEFTNENLFVKIDDTVREQDVFVVQPFSRPVNRSIMELLIMVDALKRASAARITAVVPYYAYGRTDKKDQPRVPITARLIADMITVAGASRVLTMDLHAGQIQGFFNIPVDELSALNLFARYFAAKALEDVVVVAPDLGIAKRARNLAERLSAPLAVIEKRRRENNSRSEILNVIGDVRNRRVIIFDDEVDTGGSLVNAARALKDLGAAEVYAAFTHAVFSGPAYERIAASPIRELVFTDTIPIAPENKQDKMTILSVAPLFAEAIQRIHGGGSVGALFR